jgi:hypothetical protein
MKNNKDIDTEVSENSKHKYLRVLEGFVAKG